LQLETRSEEDPREAMKQITPLAASHFPEISIGVYITHAMGNGATSNRNVGFISRLSITSAGAFRSFRAGTDARLFMRLWTPSKLGRFPHNGESERVT